MPGPTPFRCLGVVILRPLDGCLILQSPSSSHSARRRVFHRPFRADRGVEAQRGIREGRRSMLLEFVDVAKVYRGGVRGVDGVTMRLGAGLVGLLGPNGAGKSSLMRIAATVTRPTCGQVLFDGTDAVARPGL